MPERSLIAIVVEMALHALLVPAYVSTIVLCHSLLQHLLPWLIVSRRDGGSQRRPLWSRRRDLCLLPQSGGDHPLAHHGSDQTLTLTCAHRCRCAPPLHGGAKDRPSGFS